MTMLYTLSWMLSVRVAVGDDLVVGDEHVGVHGHVLQLDTALEACRSSGRGAGGRWGGRR